MQLQKAMAGKDEEMIREAVGIFLDKEALQRAIDELLASGFQRTAFGLLAGENAVKEKLGHIYKSTNQYMEGSNAPNTAFVHKESVGDTFHALAGQLSFLGVSTLAGAAVLSAGVLGGALLAASAGALAVGAVGAVVGMIIHQSDAEYLEEHVNAGNLVFFVRVNNSSEEAKAKAILSKHCNFDINAIKVLNVPANRHATLAI